MEHNAYTRVSILCNVSFENGHRDGESGYREYCIQSPSVTRLTAIAFCDQCCGIPFSDWHGQGLGLKPLFLPFCVVIQILLHRYYRTSFRSKMKITAMEMSKNRSKCACGFTFIEVPPMPEFMPEYQNPRMHMKAAAEILEPFQYYKWPCTLVTSTLWKLYGGARPVFLALLPKSVAGNCNIGSESLMVEVTTSLLS